LRRFWQPRISPICPYQEPSTELPATALVHWSVDHWRTVKDTPTKDSGLDIHFVDLELDKRGGAIVFTLYWSAEDRWEGVDYEVAVQ